MSLGPAIVALVGLVVVGQSLAATSWPEAAGCRSRLLFGVVPGARVSRRAV